MKRETPRHRYVPNAPRDQVCRVVGAPAATRPSQKISVIFLARICPLLSVKNKPFDGGCFHHSPRARPMGAPGALGRPWGRGGGADLADFKPRSISHQRKNATPLYWNHIPSISGRYQVKFGGPLRGALRGTGGVPLDVFLSSFVLPPFSSFL